MGTWMFVFACIEKMLHMVLHRTTTPAALSAVIRFKMDAKNVTPSEFLPISNFL
jgi:hypothetical protein